MRYPWKYILIDGQWHIDKNGYVQPASPEGSLDVLVGDEWQMGSITPDKNGKWMVHSAVSQHSWELQEGQWAFYRTGSYEWTHPKRPRGKCICDVNRMNEDGLDGQCLGMVIMDLAHYPLERSLWIDNGIYILLANRYFLHIDLMRSMQEVEYDEDVFFWGC